jgi:tetratricopeptide (TPR) repeat protein
MRRARRWLGLARFWHLDGDLDEAARYGRRLLGLVSTGVAVPTSPPDGPVPAMLAAEIALMVGLIERDRTEYSPCRRHLWWAVELLESQPASVDRDLRLARTLTVVADVDRRSGRYEHVAAALSRARCLLRGDDWSLRDDAGPDPAATVAALTAPTLLVEILTVEGIAAKERGAFDEAARCYAEIARLLVGLAAPTAHSVALHHNLAGLAHARQRYVEAEAHARRALALRRTGMRGPAVDLAQDLAVLAAALAGQQRHAEAVALFDEAIAICRTARPPRSYEIAVHLHNLASMQQTLGNHTRADPLYRESLAIKERLLGSEHPEVGLVANNLGTLLHDQGRLAEAAICYRRALTIAERTYAPEHPAVVGTRKNLAGLGTLSGPLDVNTARPGVDGAAGQSAAAHTVTEEERAVRLALG